MIPNLPTEVNQILVLRALQMKPHIYAGTALPKDPRRRAKRIKQLDRDNRRETQAASV